MENLSQGMEEEELPNSRFGTSATTGAYAHTAVGVNLGLNYAFGGGGGGARIP